jgi:hypothetical protein
LVQGEFLFNKSYHTRARRGGMVSAGQVLQELVDRAGDRQAFYRPRRRPRPGVKNKRSGKPAGLQQLELFADPPRVITTTAPADETADEMFDRLFPS